jgi:hypothetical protein
LIEYARCVHSFADRGVHGRLRIQQLTQTNDRQRVNLRMELLTWTRKQTLQERI